MSYEERIYNETVDSFIAALDKHDLEAVHNLFAESVRKNLSDQEIESLFAAYSGPTDICKRDGSMVAGSYSNHYGSRSAEISSGFPVVSNGQYYWCYIDLMYRNDQDNTQIGVQRIDFYSASYRCAELFEEITPVDKNETGFFAFMDSPVSYEVRFISGYPEKYTSVSRILTKEQVSSFFKQKDPKCFSAFAAQYGLPNAEDFTGSSFSYELIPENDEPRYLKLYVSADGDSIVSASIVSDLEWLSSVWTDNEGVTDDDKTVE